VDIPVPGNDDAMRAIDLVLKELASAVCAGVGARKDVAEKDQQAPRRRSRRPTMARAEGEEEPTDEPTAEAPAAPAEPAPTVAPAPAPADPSDASAAGAAPA